MKYFIVTLISFILSGCFWQTANNIDLQKAVYFCDGIKNVQQVNIKFVGTESVVCTDGSYANTSEIKLPKENNQ